MHVRIQGCVKARGKHRRSGDKVASSSPTRCNNLQSQNHPIHVPTCCLPSILYGPRTPPPPRPLLPMRLALIPSNFSFICGFPFRSALGQLVPRPLPFALRFFFGFFSSSFFFFRSLGLADHFLSCFQLFRLEKLDACGDAPSSHDGVLFPFLPFLIRYLREPHLIFSPS